MAGHEGGILLLLSLRTASSATVPASLVASVIGDGANVSGHVASHTRTCPPFHGTIVAPSYRVKSDLLANYLVCIRLPDHMYFLKFTEAQQATVL